MTTHIIGGLGIVTNPPQGSPGPIGLLVIVLVLALIAFIAIPLPVK